MDSDNQSVFEDAQLTAEMLLRVEAERYKLKAAKALTRYLSLAIKILIGLVFGGSALLSATIAAALYWGAIIGSLPLAFLYISGILLAVVILIFLLGKHLFVRPILKGLISEIFDEE